MTARHIVALGGGGFSMEPENPFLDDFILELSGKRRPKIVFLATASGDADGYIERFYKAMPQRRCQASHLSLFKRTIVDSTAFLLRHDVIYVGGGNTANMLAIWRVHGVDRALRTAWRQGVVLAGISAGANCWFEASSTDSFGPLSVLRDGLGLLPGSVCPHYDGEKNRRPTFHRFVASNQLPGGYALDDGAAVHFVGRRLAEAVSSRPQAKAYRVFSHKRRVVEEVITTRFLGVASSAAVR
ncbi:MAG: peptidase E [Verrucomicrobiota bacterium]